MNFSQQNDDNDLESSGDHDGDINPEERPHVVHEPGSISPTPPRFKKETQRGVKRNLDFAKYRAEANRRKMVYRLMTGAKI